MNEVLLTYVSAFLCQIVTLVHGHERDKILYRFSRNEPSASHKHSHSHLFVYYNAPQKQENIVAQSMDNARDVTYVPHLQPACPPVQVIALPSASKVHNKNIAERT